MLKIAHFFPQGPRSTEILLCRVFSQWLGGAGDSLGMVLSSVPQISFWDALYKLWSVELRLRVEVFMWAWEIVIIM